jgi:hypothetical protein
LSSWTCFVNWLRGFPAVEHSAPPRNDISKGLQNQVKEVESGGEIRSPLLGIDLLSKGKYKGLLIYMQMDAVELFVDKRLLLSS